MLATVLAKVEQLVSNAVLAKAVDTYVVNDEFMGSVEFYPFATQNGGSMVLTVNRYNSDSGASGRNIGEDYVEGSAVNEPVTFHLKPIGGKFTVDKALARTMTDNGRAVFVTNQVRQKANATKNEVARQFIDGDGSPRSLSGLKRVAALENRISTDTIDISGSVTREKAEAFLEFFNKQISKSNVEFNRIYCDREFAATLATFKQLLNQTNTPVRVGDLQMREFLGIPVVWISGVDFDEPGALAGEVRKSFYLVRQSDDDGVCLGLPSDSTILMMQDPFEGGNVIQEGFVECVTQVVVINPNALLKCAVITRSGV